MQENILTLAAELVGDDTPSALLTALCAAAETAWRGRLRAGLTAEDCGEAFACAAALSAAADYLAGRGGGEVTSFTAGAVSIQTGRNGGDSTAPLRQAAERLMRPFCTADDAALLGVPG